MNDTQALMWMQASGPFHPLTCRSGRRMDGHHNSAKAILGDRDWGLLRPVDGGLWKCPACDYTQPIKAGDIKVSQQWATIAEARDVEA